MPLEVNEINKIDERFFFQSGNILFFSVVLTETSPEKSKTINSWFVAKFFTLELIHFN